MKTIEIRNTHVDTKEDAVRVALSTIEALYHGNHRGADIRELTEEILFRGFPKRQSVVLHTAALTVLVCSQFYTGGNGTTMRKWVLPGLEECVAIFDTVNRVNRRGKVHLYTYHQDGQDPSTLEEVFKITPRGGSTVRCTWSKWAV